MHAQKSTALEYARPRRWRPQSGLGLRTQRRPRRNPQRAAVAGALGAILLTFATPPAAACACGGFAPPEGSTVTVAQERAIISWENGREQIELSLGVDSDVVKTGFIFPTPAPADVSLGSISNFDDLEAAIAPKTVYYNSWWGGAGSDTGAWPGAAATGAAGAPPPPVILNEVQLGPVQASTIQASDASGLTNWLTGNGFELKPAVAALLAGYIQRSWYFVVLTMTSGAELAGELDPIKFTFDSTKLVYPLELSKAATATQTLRLYVFDEHRTEVAADDAPATFATPTVTHWAGVAPAQVGGRGRYLTVLDLTFTEPSVQISGDLEFVRAANDNEFNQNIQVARPVRFLFLPAGVAAIFGGIIALPILLSLLRGARDWAKSARLRRTATQSGEGK
jgi:Uncharacterized protein conserved in bacteria (DUF2330)